MNDLAWRKFPVNTIRNEDLDYIAFLLPESMKSAPFMFYMTAICKCDDDGVFDIEDGTIFSRLMRIGSPVDVFNIAKFMTQRRILTQVLPNSTIFMITDWDPPERRGVIKTKSAEERRFIIAQKIEAEKKARLQNAPAPSPVDPFSSASTIYPKAEEVIIFPDPVPAPVTVDFDQMRQMRDQNDTFFCHLNDKNAQNVETRERERERQIQRDTETEDRNKEIEKKETHTEAESACGPMDGPTADPAEENKAENIDEQKKAEIEAVSDNAPSTGDLADEAIGPINDNREARYDPSEMAELEAIANDFFVRNSLIFDKEYDHHVIIKLCVRVARLKTPNNPAPVVMKTILRQFKIRATTKGDYFYNCKITPQFLLKANTWSHILQQASALLLTHKENDSEWKFQIQTKNPEEQLAIDNDMISQCLQYGIDPNDPQRAAKLLRAQNGSPNEQNTG